MKRMKKNAAKMAELWEHFPTYISSADEDQIIRDALPQFLFYEKKKNSAWCFCTACRGSDTFRKDVYINGIRIGGSDFAQRLRHNDVGTCPMCGHKVTYKCEGRGHRTLEAHGNYAVCSARDNMLFIHAVRVRTSWADLEEPYTDIEYHRKYIISEWGAEEKRWSWQTGGFTLMKKINEPIFGNMLDFEESHNYTLINEDIIGDTFLRYLPFYAYCNTAVCVLPIRFLLFGAKNPQLVEQLWKCGFSQLVEEAAATPTSEYIQLIDWKRTEVKKALGFNSEEMRLWKDMENDIEVLHKLYAYMRIKRIKEIKSPKMIMSIINNDGLRLIDTELKLVEKCGATFTKVRNYIYKMSETELDRNRTASEWLDCINMLDQLDYPAESVLRFPKSIMQLHNRLVDEIRRSEDKLKRKADKPLDDMIAAQKAELAKLMYGNLLYETVLPESMQDIRDEGRVLDHCVASYAERHAKGITHIFFIRKRWKPEERWYTIEVTKEGYIRQCYGYKDNRTISKPDSMLRFEEEYQIFLNHAFGRLTDAEYARAAAELNGNASSESEIKVQLTA